MGVLYYIGGCPNFQGGTAGKIRENGPKTGNSFIMQIEKVGNSRPGFWQVHLLTIFRHSTTIAL